MPKLVSATKVRLRSGELLRRDAVVAAYSLGQRIRSRRGTALMAAPEEVIHSEREARDSHLADLR